MTTQANFPATPEICLLCLPSAGIIAVYHQSQLFYLSAEHRTQIHWTVSPNPTPFLAVQRIQPELWCLPTCQVFKYSGLKNNSAAPSFSREENVVQPTSAAGSLTPQLACAATRYMRCSETPFSWENSCEKQHCCVMRLGKGEPSPTAGSLTSQSKCEKQRQ